MNELRDLMDRTAGEPVALTDAELREFARDGRKAVRRRRGIGIAAAAIGTAGAVTVTWLIAPGGPQAEPGVAGTGSTVTSTPTATATATTRVGRVPSPVVRVTINPPPRPAKPVPLVAKSTSDPEAGVACDLTPTGLDLVRCRVAAEGSAASERPRELRPH